MIYVLLVAGYLCVGLLACKLAFVVTAENVEGDWDSSDTFAAAVIVLAWPVVCVGICIAYVCVGVKKFLLWDVKTAHLRRKTQRIESELEHRTERE